LARPSKHEVGQIVVEARARRARDDDGNEEAGASISPAKGFAGHVFLTNQDCQSQLRTNFKARGGSSSTEEPPRCHTASTAGSVIRPAKTGCDSTKLAEIPANTGRESANFHRRGRIAASCGGAPGSLSGWDPAVTHWEIQGPAQTVRSDRGRRVIVLGLIPPVKR